jgi:hypothetical protein
MAELSHNAEEMFQALRFKAGLALLRKLKWLMLSACPCMFAVFVLCRIFSSGYFASFERSVLFVIKAIMVFGMIVWLEGVSDDITAQQIPRRILATIFLAVLPLSNILALANSSDPIPPHVFLAQVIIPVCGVFE